MSEWKTIETAPKDGTKIDLWCEREGKVSLRIPNAYFYEERWLHSFNGMRVWHTPTHWMPLPEPPARALLSTIGEPTDIGATQP